MLSFVKIFTSLSRGRSKYLNPKKNIFADDTKIVITIYLDHENIKEPYCLFRRCFFRMLNWQFVRFHIKLLLHYYRLSIRCLFLSHRFEL